MIRFNYPWEHYVIDNFFSKELFDRLKDEEVNSINFEDSGRGRDSVTERCFITRDYKADLGQSLINEYTKYFNTLFPIAGNLDDSHYRMELTNDNDMYHCDPHLDSNDKKITIITYINALKNLGTDLYEYFDAEPYIVNWKDNRSLIFKPDETKWHGMRKHIFKGKRRIMIFNCVIKENWKLKEQLWIN